MELRSVAVGVVDARGHALPMRSGAGHGALAARGHPPGPAAEVHRHLVSIILSSACKRKG